METVAQSPEPRLTRRQAAILSAFTGITCGPFEDVQLLADKLFGRPTWTHEFADEKMAAELKEKVRPLFLDLCAEREGGS
jgi:hypothetical protein